jgi:quercetin dioxygenase-like cupin family protein
MDATKAEREFLDPTPLPWRPAAGFAGGVWEQVISGGEDEGVTTRLLRFDPGGGNDRVVTHDFWEEIYVVSGTLECGGRLYPAGSVAVRPPGMPHGPFHSESGCVSFEVRYRTR